MKSESIEFLEKIALSIPADAPSSLPFLPRPMLDALHAKGCESRRELFLMALKWMQAKQGVSFNEIKRQEIVYQAFLGPFLGFRNELGGLHSLIATLPYIIDKLSVTTILLLPIAERGEVRKKGLTSSPFSVKSFSQIDKSVLGPWTEEDGVEIWSSIVSACSGAGIRLGTIVPTATISMDSEYITEEPSLVYWWESPTDAVLTGRPIKTSVKFSNEAVPYISAEHKFTKAPSSASISVGDDGLYYAESINGNVISVCNAFPDPAVSLGQDAAWKDVAAVRSTSGLIPNTYNQGRRGIGDLTPAYKKHLKKIVKSLAIHKEKAFLLDVSSALPKIGGFLDKHRYPDYFLVAEQLWNFEDENSFEFILGPFIPCVASHSHFPRVIAESLKYHVELLRDSVNNGTCRWYFAGIANHDTVPCDPNIGLGLLPLLVSLPRSIPHIYSGTDFFSQIVTNFEFGELPDSDLKEARSRSLLFNIEAVEISQDNMEYFCHFWQDVLTIREMLYSDNPRRLLAEKHPSDEAAVISVGEAIFVLNFSEKPIAYRLQKDGKVACAVTAGRKSHKICNNEYYVGGKESIIFIPMDSFLFYSGRLTCFRTLDQVRATDEVVAPAKPPQCAKTLGFRVNSYSKISPIEF